MDAEQQQEEQLENDVEQMQITIEQARKQAHLGECLDRLQQHPDFQKLIMEDYLKDQTARLGHLLSDDAMQDKQRRKKIIKEIEAIGNFLSYLRVVGQRAQMATAAIKNNEEELRNIAQERGL